MRARLAMGAILLLAAVPRLWAALGDMGIFWPDEIYQTMEPAHRFAFGYGVRAWEFREGARSWLMPGVIGLVWKAAAAVGVHSSEGLVGLAKVGMAGLGVVGVWAGMRLARTIRGADDAAYLAGIFGALCPPLVVFGSRCMTEMATAPILVLVAWWLETPGRRRSVVAGAFASLTIFLRYQNGLMTAGFAVLLLARRRWSDAKAYGAGAVVVGLMGGLLDWPTWGYPFHAFWVYVRSNLLLGRASAFGTSPSLYFAHHLYTSIGASFVVLLVGLALALRRASGLVLVTYLYFVVHSFVPHKELRFLMPVVPLGLSLAAVGLSDRMNGRAPWALGGVGLACGLQMAWQLRAPTRAQLGFGDSDRVIWHSGEDYLRTAQRAAKDPDLCGLSYVATNRAWTGGYTYLHRHVPIFFDIDPSHLPCVNAVVGAPDEPLPAEWKRTYTNGSYALWKRPGTCAPPPAGWDPTL